MVVLMLAPETITALIAGAVGIVLAIMAVVALDRLRPPQLRREFTVEFPLEQAWRHLARVWAKHIST
jgi:biopolymer transport protein ExbB/TolQ